MRDSLVYSPVEDDGAAAISAESAKESMNESGVKRSSSVVDLTDSPQPAKKAPTIGNDFKSTFIPPIRIGGTSLLPMGGNRLSLGCNVSTEDSPNIAVTSDETKITLSSSQKRVVDAIMARKSVFFSGAAGSGKSYLLKVVQDVLDSIDKGDRIAFTAPTGVAACNIRGMTIHAWAGIGLGKDTSDRIVGPIMRNREVRARWTETDILVIDEISMLSGETFDLLSEVGSRVRGDDRPFGGLQLVMCGDFFQLPPVGLGKSCTFCFQSQTWKTLFYGGSGSSSSSGDAPAAEMIFLHKGFRQNDSVFLRVLNELRRGIVSSKTDQILTQKVTEYQRQMYEKRKRISEAAESAMAAVASAAVTTSSFTTTSTAKTVTPLHNKKQSINAKKEVSKEVVATKLYSTNRNVDEYNDAELRKLNTKSYVFQCVDEGADQYLKQLRAGMKAVETLELKVGAQVLLLKNLDTSRGLVNGAKGVVTGFEMQLLSEPSSSIAGAFPQSNAKSLRDPWLPIVQFEISRGNGVKTTEVITLKREKWELTVRDRVMASRVQIPLMLAWAISVHKAQGMTIPDLEVSFQGIFEYGQAYVALSRATSLEGLHLQSYDRKAVRAHELVKEFYVRRMGAGEDIDPRDEPCIQSSVAELAATFRDPDGAFGSAKRNKATAASRRESGEWIQAKAHYGEDAGDDGDATDAPTTTTISASGKKSKHGWDDWQSIYALDDWEDLKFAKAASHQKATGTTTNNPASSSSVFGNQVEESVASTLYGSGAGSAGVQSTATPVTAQYPSIVVQDQPVLSLASMLSRDEPASAPSSGHSGSVSGSGKYVHSQQQDIRDTWSRERVGATITGQQSVRQPLAPLQQRSSFAVMKSNLFVPPTFSNTFVPPVATAPATGYNPNPPVRVTPTVLTDEQKRRIEENRQAALRKQAALRLQRQEMEQHHES